MAQILQGNSPVAYSSAESVATPLEDALSKFLAILTDDEKKHLQRIQGIPDASAAHIFTASLNLSPARRKKIVDSRVYPILLSVQNFSNIVDTFHLFNPTTAASLWGSIKLTLLIAVNTTFYLESLSILFMDLSNNGHQFDDYLLLFPGSSELQRSMCKYHASIVEFCKQFILLTRQSLWKKLTTSLIDKLQPHMKNIQQHSNDVKYSIALIQARYNTDNNLVLRDISGSFKETLAKVNKNAETVQRIEKGQTDSGYGSTTTTTRSGTIKDDFSDISHSEVYNYISELATNLLLQLPPDSVILNRVAGILAERLREFALRLGHQAPNQKHLDVMLFIHRYRHTIAQSFKENCLASTEEEHQLLPESNKISQYEWLKMWDERCEYAGEPFTDPPDVRRDYWNLPEPALTDVLAYREIILDSPVYQWLVVMLRREFYISRAKPDVMAQIRKTTLQCLHPRPQVRGRKYPETYTVRFYMNWDPFKFFIQQEYGISADKALRRALTLTASSGNHVQCIPCLNYLRQLWPFTGDSFIKFINKVLCDPYMVNRGQLPDSTILTSPALESPSFVVVAEGSMDSISEIAEMLSWLVTAFASSPVDQGITYFRPVINQIPRHPTATNTLCFDFRIYHEIHLLNDGITQGNGQCWHSLFQNPVVVYGYPILRRPHHQPGLEISLSIMAALLDEERVNVFQNRLYVKGFNAMLVPTRRFDNYLLWHLLINEDKTHISYLKSKSVETDDTIRLTDLETHHHIVGWCSNPNYYAGASDARYNIERSRLPKPHPGCVLEKCSISGGKFITAGLSFSVGVRDRSIQITRKGYIRRLEWISKKFVVFWDESEKRGWLVDGASALLHLVRASIEHSRQGKFRSVYTFNPKDLVEAQLTHVPSSALDVLLNKENRKLKIYDDGDEDFESEEEGLQNPPKGKKPQGSKNLYCFQDRVEELFETIEKIIHYEISAGEESGVEIRARARKHLEGWDFHDLATENDPLYPRVATLDTYGKGWVDFTRSIRAITLLGKGFGDIIKPAANDSTCEYWDILPHGKYYLAAMFQDLKEVAELYGDPTSNPMKLSDDIIWHNPSPDRCQCQNPRPKKLNLRHRFRNHSEFAQVLLPSTSSEKNYRQAGPFQAFVFGHNLNFPWRWGDHDNPILISLPDSKPDVQIMSNTSNSVESSTTISIFSPSLSETTETSLDKLSEPRLPRLSQKKACAQEPDEEEKEDSITSASSSGLPHRLYMLDNAPLYRASQLKLHDEPGQENS